MTQNFKKWVNKLMKDIKRIKYVGKRFYEGRLLRGLLANKNGKSIYCEQCWNIANGIKEITIFGFIKICVPICRPHFDGTSYSKWKS